jgi:transcriptional regulator with XRE-family HTH domain
MYAIITSIEEGGTAAMSEVTNHVEKIRSSRGLTQEQVADVLGVSRATYISVTKGKRDLTTGELEKLSAYFNVPIAEFFDQPRNNEKFKQMYFYILRCFRDGVPKTKLAKLLYLADFSCFYDKLTPMSGVRYVRREYGPVADIFFELTDDLYDKGKINIKPLDYALMIVPTTIEQDDDLLSDEEKERLDRICNFWKDKRTAEIVNFTHEQKPWKMCRDGEYIPYSLIIQEDPDHVCAPNI